MNPSISITLISFILTGCVNIAVTPKIEGIVKNQEGYPVRAKVVIEHTQINKTKEIKTDKNGHYVSKLRIWTPIPFAPFKMEARVTIKANGYKTYRYLSNGTDNYAEVVLKDLRYP